MSPFIGELVGTAILILLGNGVVANVVLNKTKGNNSGWLVITLGWAIAVFVAVFISSVASGAHLNPAVTIALALVHKFSWNDVPAYIMAQLAGAMIGAALVWLLYKPHFDVTEDGDAKMAVFCTSPAISHTFNNILSEIIGSFVLVFGVLHFTNPATSLGTLNALPVALLVLGIGLSLGGTTGYAINPARDVGPRIVHFLLPMANKSNSNWGYAWIPALAPIVGAALASVLFQWLSI
jgi:glycerol uptake facilitator protein